MARGGRGLIPLILALAACPGEDPLQEPVRALVHASLPGQSLCGPEELAQRAGLVVAEDCAFTTQDPGDDPAWLRLGPSCCVTGVWWRRQAVEPGEVAVRSVPADAVPVRDSWLRGVAVDGPAAPGGELVARLFMVPPERIPLDVRVILELGEERLDAGLLLDRRVDLVPGLAERPLVRHRLRVDLPSQGQGSWPLVVVLEDASTGGELARSPLVELPVGEGLPSLEDLRRRTAEPDDKARFVDTRVHAVMVKTAEGMEERGGPPLPRIVRDQAWPLMVAGAVDPTGWDRQAALEPQVPLSGVSYLLGDAPAAVVHWDAPASREARVDPKRPRPRRALPESLRSLVEAGVDGVLLANPHAGDAGPQGVIDTELAARNQGLRTAGTPQRTTLYLPLGESGLVAGVISARVGSDPATASLSPEDLPALVQAARQHAHVVLVGLDPEQADPAELTWAVARSGADGGWLLADTLGAVDIIDGVPVLLGLPPFMEQAAGRPRSSVVSRWYLDAGGVRRIDLVPVVNQDGQIHRDRSDQADLVPSAILPESRALGTDLRIGEQVGAVDVRSHWPDRELPTPPHPPPAGPESGSLPEAALPARCTGAPAAGEGLVLGQDQVVVHTHTLVDEQVEAGQPIRVRLELEAPGPVEDVQLEWSVLGAGVTWRTRTRPCEGSWELGDLAPGQVLLDEVALWPPEGVVPGAATVEVAVRSGSQVLTGPEGARHLALGQVQLLESP